jgi:uncharacterized SAM-binding protein YcdF (DUF218 family)
VETALNVRLVAVLGYSSRRTPGLHTLCVERLRHAEQVAAPGDRVLLSGWGRRGSVTEAQLMRDAWQGAELELIADRTARNTRENAASIAEVARRLHVTEVTVVTSRWHAFRAARLVRAALPGVLVRTSSPAGYPHPVLALRELVCVLALPFHLIGARARAPARR